MKSGHPLLAAALVLLVALAGCITLSDAPADKKQDDKAPAAESRIDGMTAEVTFVDEVKDCPGSGLQVPPGRSCATRTLDAVGRIGVDQLPVDLSTVNGAIVLSNSVGDAWSFHAVIKVRALTEDQARQGLNTTWNWSHEVDGKHALMAAPTAAPGGPGDVQGLGASLEGAAYTITLPAWVKLDLNAVSTNGVISVVGFDMGKAVARTTNGAVVLQGSATDVTVDTTNGAVDLTLKPSASGSYHASTSNGAIAATFVEDAAHGYDLSASTTNGNIQILLRDGKVSNGPGPDYGSKSRSFQTDGYSTRSIQTKVDLTTTNGEIVVSG